MPFRSKQQMKACFATNGFHGKVDCHEWAHATPSIKSLPDKVKNFGGAIDYSRKKCLKCGGKPKMQQGGCFDAIGNPIPCEGQQLHEKNPGYTFTRSSSETDRLMLEAQRLKMLNGADPALTTPIQEEGESSPYNIDPIRQKNNGDWRIDNNKKVDPFQLGLGLQGVTTGLSWLSGIMDRRRQNRYLRGNLSTLGRIESQPVDNFQPNPYNLYAKLGGNIKKYMYTNDSHNTAIDETAGRMQFGGQTFFGNPRKIKNLTINQLPFPQLSDPMNALTGMLGQQPSEQGADFNEIVKNMQQGIYKKGGKWIQKAINPAHKGWCTPLSNPHCTGHRRAFALMMKRKHGFQ
jgi:hypothetical protein